ISSPISAAINHLLSHEPWAREKLAAHAGKVAAIDAGIVTVRLKAMHGGTVQVAVQNDIPDVTIRIKLSDLPLIAQNRERAFSYVNVEGDADFANTISQLANSLRWEVEEDLARFIGDIPATRIVTGARSVLGAARSTQRKLAENLSEYFLEEKPLLVRPHSVNEFADDVAKLRDDVERLGKRIAKLGGLIDR
ncbi:MAG: sterol-binding protein, partial [Noviherbaspirillum sp.]|nr:sterol-binding protein [Noviherbaspirillum sp.]